MLEEILGEIAGKVTPILKSEGINDITFNFSSYDLRQQFSQWVKEGKPDRQSVDVDVVTVDNLIDLIQPLCVHLYDEVKDSDDYNNEGINLTVYADGTYYLDF